MKKLMTLLGVVSLSVAPAAVLISCATPEHLDADGNSIILEFGKGVGEDGKLSLDSKAILEEIQNKPGFKNKILQDVLQIINHSFLNNLDLFFNTDPNSKDNAPIGTPKNEDFQFYDDSTYSTLNTIWTNINESVDNQIKDEKESMQKEYGKKKWEKKWYEKLVAKFPNFQKDIDDADKPFLDKKYKMSLLIDGDENIEGRIQKTLIDNNHSGFSFVEVKKLEILWNEYRNEILNNKEKFIEKLTNPSNELLRKEFSQIYNSQFENIYKGETKQMIYGDELLDGGIAKEKVDSITASPIKNSVPDVINDYSVKEKGIEGILSNSQNYFLNNYFKTKAPVVISEVSFSYSTGTEFEKGINNESIIDFGTSKPATKLNKFITAIDGVKSDAAWIELVTNAQFNSDYGGSLTKADKIMTIDGDQDSFLKSVVYNEVLGLTTTKQYNANNKEGSGSGVDLLNQINRTDPGTLSTKIGNNILVYADASGVHFIYLHGNILGGEGASEPTTKNDSPTSYSRLNGMTNGIISKELFDQQNDLNDFYKQDGPTQKLIVSDYKKQATKDEEITSGNLLNINNSIDNEYAKYLINNTIASKSPKVTDSFSTYDFMGAMTDWAKSGISSSTDTLDAKLEIYDYFKNLFKFEDDTKDKDMVFLETFIDFGKDEFGKELLENIVKNIKTLRGGSNVTSAMKMEKQAIELKKTIDGINKTPSVDGLTPPTKFFEDGTFIATKLTESIINNFKLFKSNQDVPSNYFDLLSTYMLKGGN